MRRGSGNPNISEIGKHIVRHSYAKANINKIKNMTKAEIVWKVSNNLGLDKNEVLATVENLMEEIKSSLNEGENVYLRGFGSFIVKKIA